MFHSLVEELILRWKAACIARPLGHRHRLVIPGSACRERRWETAAPGAAVAGTFRRRETSDRALGLGCILQFQYDSYIRLFVIIAKEKMSDDAP